MNELVTQQQETELVISEDAKSLIVSSVSENTVTVALQRLAFSIHYHFILGSILCQV